jgi:hypothetical protein
MLKFSSVAHKLNMPFFEIIQTRYLLTPCEEVNVLNISVILGPLKNYFLHPSVVKALRKVL